MSTIDLKNHLLNIMCPYPPFLINSLITLCSNLCNYFFMSITLYEYFHQFVKFEFDFSAECYGYQEVGTKND